MAVVFKKKAVQPIAPKGPESVPKAEKAEELTERQKAALEAVGLLGAPKEETYNPAPPPSTQPEKIVYPVYSAGDKVEVVNTFFTWVKEWKAGDTGVVTRFWNAVPETRAMGPGYGVVEVRLDNPRVPEKPLVLLHQRDLQPRQ